MFHTSFHILSLAAIILGLVAIVDFKKWGGMDLYNFQVMWSGHSWMGALTVALWGLQFIFSVWMHAIAKWPEGTEDTKAFYNEIHKFVGYCVYAVGLASCASGFQDMQGSDYAGFQSDAAAAMLANPDMTLAQMVEMSTPGLGNELASVGETKMCAVSEMNIKSSLSLGIRDYFDYSIILILYHINSLIVSDMDISILSTVRFRVIINRYNINTPLTNSSFPLLLFLFFFFSSSSQAQYCSLLLEYQRLLC